MKEYLVHIPTSSFEFVEVKASSPEEAKELRDEVMEAFQEAKNTPQSGLNKIDLLRLLYKPLCGGGITEDELDTLGTNKDYSQRDILNIIKNLIAKSKRDNGDDRLNKEIDIRYN